MAFDTPRRPRPWTTAGPPERPDLDIVQPELGAGTARRARRQRPRVAQHVRRLEVDEIGDGQQRRVELRLVEVHAESRFGRRSPRPRSRRASNPSRIVSALAQNVGGHDGSNWDPARLSANATAAPIPPIRWATSVNSPICANLRCDRDVLALELPGPALPVPLLVGGTDRILHSVRKAELLGQAPGQGSVLDDHPVQVAMPGDRELHADPEAVQGRVAAAHQPQHGQRPARAAQLMSRISRT